MMSVLVWKKIKPYCLGLMLLFIMIKIGVAQSVSVYVPSDTGCEFYDRASDTSNPAPGPSDLSWDILNAAAETSASTNDSSWYETRRTTARNQFDSQLFKFLISEDVADIVGIDLYWIGYGENQTGYECYLYIWNVNTTTWELLESAEIGTPDGNLFGSITSSLTDYVDGSNYIYVLAQAKHYNYAPTVTTLVSPLSGSSLPPNPATVTVQWNTTTDPDNDATIEYYCYIRESNDLWSDNSTWISGTSYISTLPWQGRWYYWSVDARDDLSFTSGATAEWSFYRPWSCPLYFVYDGGKREFNYVTDIMGPAIWDKNKAIGKTRDYYIVMGENIKPDENNNYRIKIRETMNEITYVDKGKLVLIDHPRDYEIYTSSAEKHSRNSNYYPEEFKIYTIHKDAKIPISAVTKDGVDFTDKISKIDNQTAPLPPKTEEVVEYIFDFGKITAPEKARLVIDGWCYTDMEKNSSFPTKLLLVKNNYSGENPGDWEEVRTIGQIAGDFKTMVIEIGHYLKNRDCQKIKFIFDNQSKKITIIDRIRLDCSDEAKISLTYVDPVEANLSYKGKANFKFWNSDKHRMICPDDSNPISPEWLGKGAFTKYGDVLDIVKTNDDQYVIMNSGDQLEMVFPNIKPIPEDMTRTIIFDNFIWFKPARAKNLAYVNPLPFRGMMLYPYNGISWISYPFTKDNLEYINTYNTRIYNDDIINKYKLQYIKSMNFAMTNTQYIKRSLNTNFCSCSVIYDSGGGGGTTPPSVPALGAPADLSTDVETSKTFTWNPSSGTAPITYDLQVSTDPAFLSPEFDYTGITTEYKDVTGLVESTLYYWRVRGVNAFGTSLWANQGSEWSFTCGGSPTTPTLLTPVDNAIDQSVTPTLTWNASTGSGVISYTLEIDDDVGFGSVDYTVSNLLITEAVPTGLVENIKYYWHISATNTFGTSSWSTAQNFTTGTSPTLPVLQTPPDTSTGLDLPVTLKWSASTGSPTIQYQVEIDDNSDFSSPEVSQTGIDVTSFIVDNLVSGTTYYWRVLGVNDIGNSGWSSSQSFMVDVSGTAPSQPTLSSPSDLASDLDLSITLLWDESTGTTPITYSLQVATDSGFTSLLYNETSISDKWYRISGLSYSTTYYWRVMGSNTAGDSSWSSYYTLITKDSGVTTNPPSDPILISPENGAGAVYAEEKLVWAPSSGDGTIVYSLEIAEDSNFSNLILSADQNISKFSYKLPSSTFFPGKTYYWHIKSTNEYGSSEWSTTWSFIYAEPDNVIVGGLITSPVIGLDHSNIAFEVSEGSTITVSSNIDIWNSGGDSLNWSATSNEDWLSISPSSGAANATGSTLTITVDPTGFSELSYEGDITFVDSYALNSPQSIHVEVKVILADTTSTETNLIFAPVITAPVNEYELSETIPTLVWQSAAGGSGSITYEVVLTQDSSFSTVMKYYKDLDGLSKKVEEELVAGVYYWRVRAKDKNGYSAWSQSGSFRLGNVEEPLSPSCFIKSIFK